MIGVFDSGHGGLTVLNALVGAFPKCGFIYLGDHANAPYGDRSPEDIYELTRSGVEKLFDLGCALVIIACNTAAATSLRRLQQTWLAEHFPDRRVLGVFVPVVEEITEQSWKGNIGAQVIAKPRSVGVFATPRTVESGSFVQEISRLSSEIAVYQQSCPHLVPLIEQGASENVLGKFISEYVSSLMEKVGKKGLDVVVLGCTHYPLIQNLFERALPEGVSILSQPSISATSLALYLERHPEFADSRGQETIIYSTGNAQAASRSASMFLGREIQFSTLETTRLGCGEAIRRL